MQNNFSLNDLYIPFPNKSKFASKHIDAVAHEVFSALKKKNIRLKFDLTSFEWIAPESLIFITALFSHFNNNNIPFFVNFKKQRLPEDVSKKDAKRLIYIWEKWGIAQLLRNTSFIVPDYSKFCDIDDKYIKGLKRQHNIDEDSGSTEMYNDWKIVTNIPFYSYQSSESYDKYDEQTFELSIDECVTLLEDDEDIDLQQLNDKLKRNPIIDKTLSSIILRELFENSIKHGYEGKSAKELYFGLGFNKAKKDSRILRLNFESEAIPETWSFFTNNNEFKNESFIEFSFIDFGNGIYSTLQEEYENFISDDNNRLDLSSEHFEHHQHSRILEYAFHFNSSRNPIYTRFKGELIPRGLYDLLSIIWRYKGVLIVRSGYGKILYNFSDEKIIHPKDAIRFFDNENLVFNGTMMTIYLPNNQSVIKKNVIRPITNIQLNTLEKNQYIDVLRLISNAKKNDGLSFYNLLFQELDIELRKRFIQTEDAILPLDFAGCNFEKEATKKILMYLVTTHNIKLSTTVIALNIEEEAFIEQIQDELIKLGSIRKEFVFQPILCLFENIKEKSQNTIWIGIHDRNEEKQLNKSLFNFIESHSQGNKSINEWLVEGYLPQLVEENMIRAKNDEIKIYLTSGNYFQTEFLSFLNTFQNEQLVQRISTHLVRKLCSQQFENTKSILQNTNDSKIALISITISSQLLAKAVKKDLENTFPVTQFELIRLSNYYSFYTERPFLNMANQSVILVCDVIATGYLLGQVQKMLESLENVKLIGIMCVSDTRNSNKVTQHKEKILSKYWDDDIDKDKELTISLLNTNIDKYPFKGFFEKKENKDPRLDIERINPITNGLNTRNKHDYSDNCLFSTEEFLNFLPRESEKFLKIGFIEHNQTFHTYYFETDHFFRSNEGITFIELCLNKIQQKEEIQLLNIGCVVYPIFSGAEFNINTKYKKTFNQYSKGNIDFITAPRVSTPKGWRFTTIPEQFTNKEYGTVFIIDDGSCTGETILQLLDEVSIFNLNSIIILSVIARVEDFQREFFSKISKIKSKNGDIKVSVFFGVHFHIPVYNLNTFDDFLTEEKNLKTLKSHPLLPEIAKKHIFNRLESLKRVDSSNLHNHIQPHYIPTLHDSKNYACNEIFKWRNLLGCIQGYKFYKEYFEPFTTLQKNYVSTNYRLQAIKDLEILGIIILHEPKLIQIIKDLLPDIYELLGRFVQSIIIGGIKSNELLKEINVDGKTVYKYNIDNLNYNWSSFSLICLYALTNKHDFFKQEDSEYILFTLFDFCKTDEVAQSYLIYLICNQVPISEEQKISKSNRTYINTIIKKIIEERNDIKLKNIRPELKRDLEQTLIYLSSNPFISDENSDFQKASTKIAEVLNYEKVTGDNHNTLGNEVRSVRNAIKMNPKSSILVYSWGLVREKILSLKRSSYAMVPLLKYYNNIEINEFLIDEGDNSLVSMVSKIGDFIRSEEHSIVAQKEIDSCLKILSDKFTESSLYNLLANNTSDIKEVWEKLSFQNGLKTDFELINHENYSYTLSIHDMIIHNCFDELQKNIKEHSDEKKTTVTLKNYINRSELILKSEKVSSGKNKNNNKNSGLNKIEETLKFYGVETKIIVNNDNHFHLKLTFFK